MMNYVVCPHPRSAAELVNALERGKVLGRSQRYDEESDDRWECIYLEKSYGHIHWGLWGWGSALGVKADRLVDVLEHPELWHIGTIPIDPKTKTTTEFVPDDPIITAVILESSSVV